MVSTRLLLSPFPQNYFSFAVEHEKYYNSTPPVLIIISCHRNESSHAPHDERFDWNKIMITHVCVRAGLVTPWTRFQNVKARYDGNIMIILILGNCVWNNMSELNFDRKRIRLKLQLHCDVNRDKPPCNESIWFRYWTNATAYYLLPESYNNRHRWAGVINILWV